MRAADDFDAIRKALADLHPNREFEPVDFLIMPSPKAPSNFAWKAISDRAKKWMKEYYGGGDRWHLNFSEHNSPSQSAHMNPDAKIIHDWTYREPRPEEMP